MAYESYYPAWKNRPDTSTPIDADALNHMEQGIEDAHDALAALPGTYLSLTNFYVGAVDR